MPPLKLLYYIDEEGDIDMMIRVMSRACFFAVLAVLVMGQGGKRPFYRGFSLFAHSYMGDDRRPLIKVSAIIPYSNMVFLKKNDLYEASYELYVKILDSKGKLIESAVLRDRVEVGSYEETSSRKKTSKVAKTFQLDPGDYTAEALLAIKNTQLRIPKSVGVEVPDYLSSGVGLSPPRLFTVPRQASSLAAALEGGDFLKGEEVEEKEQTTFFGFERQPAFGFEVYAEERAGKPIPCRLSYEVVDRSKRQLLYGKRKVQISGAGDAFAVTFSVDEWEPGAYIFNVRAALENPPRETTSSLRFTIEFNRAMLGKYFDQTMEILALIASSEELEGLKNASFEDRPRAWSEFWRMRDPTPNTEANEALEEHLRRVRYATTHFSSLDSGWKTDRGQVYIKYGEPDQIDTSTDPYLQGEYLIWRYFSNNLVFVFYDRFGLGDYRLIQTSMP